MKIIKCIFLLSIAGISLFSIYYLVYLRPDVFIGTVKEIDSSCMIDKICSVKVDDKWIIVDLGIILNTEDKGSVEIEYTLKKDQEIGKRVEVKAKTLDKREQSLWGNDYTIYGSKDYYIRPVN